MRNACIPFIAILTTTMVLLGGCSSKMMNAPVEAPTATTVTSQDSDADASPNAGTRSEPVSAPSSIKFSTLDGKILETVYFDYDSFTLQPEARQALERTAAWLQANSSVKVTIEGHCDERGSDEYNLALGERRAIAVKNYLTTLGIVAERLITISYGEEQPAVDGQNESAWSKNRRAEFK